MPRKINPTPFFLVFFTLSIILILLGTTGLLSGFTGLINKAGAPVRSATFSILTLPGLRNKTIESLTSENQTLRSQLVDKQNLANEDKALKDQFANSQITSISLLPAKVVGVPGFIPGQSNPVYLVIDKGSSDGVRVGSAVVLNKNLVGKVSSISEGYSKVDLATSPSTSFTAKTGQNKEISGVAKGEGDSILLDNVLLSSTLKTDDLVLTKGNLDEKGVGFPPDLIVGKIISIEKKPSDLFQKAKVQSFVNFQNLSTVFVLH